MNIITSGPEWVDIDALRSGIALYEVKKLLGEPVSLYLSPVFAPSITPSIKQLIIKREKKYPITRGRPQESDQLILVDVSDCYYLEHKALYNLNNIIEIYDHHFESRDFWSSKIREKAHIESVGSCTTLIAQLAIDHHILDKLSDESIIGLTLTGVSHTLNFQSSVTTEHDRRVYEVLENEMKKRGLWHDSIVSCYFNELEEHIVSNLDEAFENDTKYDMKLGNIICSITQCEVRDAKDFINKQKNGIEKRVVGLEEHGHAFLTIISIAEGCNYILSSDPLIQKQLADITSCKRESNLLTTDKLWMRKEIVRELIKLNP